MPQPWQTGTVIRIEQEASQTRRFYIQIPAMDSFDFKPGQFVTLDLPIHEKINKRVRSYSIASWPNGTNVIELVIVLLEGGAGTNYLFNEVTVGSELTLRGPQGVFTLPEPIDKDLFFICTGTGIAPFRSMSHHILNCNIPHRDIYLIFGCRHFEDCLYRQELTDLAEKIPAFHYIPTFSREKADAANPLLRTGYVHAIYEELCRANGSLRPANFFLCGWKNMIDEAKQRIQALGYDRKSIHQELYG
ncbi:MAG TPA: FAD-binding oxidoreductase [Puia sp.]|uniref:ferredoxin--NADP reductase n=1 Tax=Puia sp. TaxID=2045100 RepID=UPI002C73A85A|nr:FAD-binding oxidoreductase [Puia sp.]HVU97614.1 FAD-binding oxidoreductase [Puia sp.]